MARKAQTAGPAEGGSSPNYLLSDEEKTARAKIFRSQVGNALMRARGCGPEGQEGREALAAMGLTIDQAQKLVRRRPPSKADQT